MFEAIAVAWLLLFLGDFLSTFCYHVPEHVFGTLHLKTHHTAKKSFRHYAILTAQAEVLMDGLLGALPYLIIAGLLWSFSPSGAIIGLLLGQLHVWWRHTSIMSWQTPKPVSWLCQILWITTPEQHWLHHQRVNAGFGDIFTVFDQPARSWLRLLRWFRIQTRTRFQPSP